MKRIDKLNNSANQQFSVVMDDGNQVDLAFRYLPTQQAWMISVGWENFVLNGYFLKVSPNALRQWKNILPFGMAVTSTDILDPLYQNDFVTGRIKVYMLSPADVVAVEEAFYS